MEVNEIISSGILEIYAMGLANEEDVSQVERYKVEHTEVAEELEKIEAVLEGYAFGHAVSPADTVKSNLESKIFPANSTYKEETVSTAKVYSISPAWKWVAAASILLLLGSAALNYVFYDRLQDSVAANEASKQELLVKNETLNRLNQNFTIIQSKYSEPVALHGLPAAPDASAKIFWMKNTGDVYVDASNLPAAPAGKQYQLWGIVDGKPVDGGMILKTNKGNTYEIQKMKAFGSAQAFAITLETEGGNPQPQGDMYVMGEL